MNSLAQGFALEELQVEPLTGVVAGPGGREKLDPKVMDVLVHMAGHAGAVVLREDLLAELWPNMVVTDDVITRCFYELRRSLARAGGDERYRHLLETIPKRGYRLKADIRPLVRAATDPPSGSRKRMTAGAALIALAALVALAALAYLWRSPEQAEVPAKDAAPHTIAVLPFLDMSEKQDQRYLSDGVTEEILNRLSQSDALRVTSRTSSFALRNETLDVRQIAERLNVGYVLEGSVRRVADRVRITAQLIDADTNVHVWSRTYDRSVGDLFAVQDEIAASVASALQTELAGGERQRSPASIEAYEKFLQGQFLYNRRSPGDIERAIAYYEQAVALDPDYGPAWAALAGAYSLAIGDLYANQNPRLRKLQGEAAHKAVEVDPGLAVAQARLAQYYYQVQQHEKGDEHMRQATALDPDDPLVLGFTASSAWWRGDYAESVRLWRKVVARDPLSPVSRGNLGFHLFANGQPQEALEESMRALELNPTAGPMLESAIACMLIVLERYDEAGDFLARLPAGNTRDYVLALMYRAPGRGQESDAALARLAAASKDVADQVHLGEVYAWRGQDEEAFDSLLVFHRQLERESGTRIRDRWYYQNELRVSPFLKPLHGDPRWAELTAELR